MGQASPRCRSSGDKNEANLAPCFPDGSRVAVEAGGLTSFLRPCRPARRRPAGVGTDPEPVQPVIGKACDPGSHRAQLSNRAVGWKRPSIIRLPPPDRSSRPRSCGGMGSSMAEVLGAGIKGIKKERNNANTAADLGWRGDWPLWVTQSEKPTPGDWKIGTGTLQTHQNASTGRPVLRRRAR